MRKLVVAAVALAAAAAVPTAAMAVGTSVSFTVAAANGLSIAGASGTSTLDSSGSNPVFDLVSDSTVSGDLDTFTVTDERGSIGAGWTVTVSGGDWVNQSDNSQTVGAFNGRAYFNVADATELTSALDGLITGMAITGGEFQAGTSNLSSSYPLLTGTTALGTGSIQFTPVIDVTVPAGTPAGTYTATVSVTAS